MNIENIELTTLPDMEELWEDLQTTVSCLDSETYDALSYMISIMFEKIYRLEQLED